MKRIVLLFCICIAPLLTQAQQQDSLSIKIGQMLLIGFPKSELDSAVLQEVAAGKVGSIIAFEKNIPASNSFIALKKILWTYQKAAPIPLLIGIDQEGGKVNRLKDKYGFPRTITHFQMAKSGSLDSVRLYAEAIATTLAGLGFNINFAPVVDLNINPDNPAISRHGRSFSINEDSVILLAKEYIKQHRKHGVLTSIKHFPGHGSSKDDTHLGLTDVTTTWREAELEPYKQLIDSGYAETVMTSHIVNRKLDQNGLPGTLSYDIITGILRQRFNYDGVVFTDDMQMHAITKHYGLEEAIRLTINAGVDIMTFSNNIAGSDQRTVDKVHGVIRSLVEQGKISPQRIDQSYRRVMRLKQNLIKDQNEAELKRQLAEREIALQQARTELAKKEAELKEALEPKTKKKKKKKKS